MASFLSSILLPVAVGAVALVLLLGLINMMRGGSPNRSQQLMRLRVLSSQVERLERDIDSLNANLAPLTSFVLPGGTAAAAYLHLARTVCRRAERIMVELAAKPDEPVSDAAIQYMNRLSDFLFVASRSTNDNGAGDVLWVPGQNR